MTTKVLHMNVVKIKKVYEKFLVSVRGLFTGAFLGASLLALCPGTASATSVSGAKITSILWAQGRILVYLNATHPVVCGCCGDRYEIGVTDAHTQALMSLIMTAYAQQKTVNIGGTGSCNTTDSEWIDSIHLN